MEEEKKQNGFWKGFFCATLIFILIIGVGAGMFAGISGMNREETSAENRGMVTADIAVQSKLRLLESYIRRLYLDEIDDETLEDYLYYGLVAGLRDPYAAYYNEEETQSMMDSSMGSYCGIGAVFSQNMTTGVITVSKVYEGCPSYEAGILPGDILYKVEGEEFAGEDLSTIVTKIKGEEGTEVTISMLRGEEVIDFTMKRQVIEVPTISFEMLEGNTGYILISEFDTITAQQFHESLMTLQEGGMEQLVIDLRNNPGGSLEAVCSIADELLGEGPIVFTEQKGKDRTSKDSDASCLEIPIAVLMNENSASASEILAGALQDYGKGIIVGKQSYGKGIVQSIIDLRDGTALKVTTAKYYTPKGNDIHKIGITPDVEIDLPDELKNKVELSFEEDVQLQKAIEVLQQ